MVEFKWDEDKRLSNLKKHGFDFEDARLLFDGRPVLTSTSQRGDEVRYVTTALFLARYVTVVWTRRDPKVRIISMKRARHAEEREYRQLHG